MTLEDAPDSKGAYEIAKELVELLEPYREGHKISIDFGYDDGMVVHDIEVTDGDELVLDTEREYFLETCGAEIEHAYGVWLDTLYEELTSEIGRMELRYEDFE